MGFKAAACTFIVGRRGARHLHPVSRRGRLLLSVAVSALGASAVMASSSALAQNNPDLAPAPSVARAQASGPTSAVRTTSRGPGLEEVTVTAQRRSEKLSKVPLSVTALSAATLKTQVVTHEQDLAALVPGLVVKNGQNQNQVSFTLRGQTLDPFSGASPAVLTYLNEVPFTRRQFLDRLL